MKTEFFTLRRNDAKKKIVMLRPVLDVLAPALILGQIVGLFALLPTADGQPMRDFFLASDNLRFIAAQWIVIGLGTAGMALVLLNGGIDLSAGASTALAGVVAATLLTAGQPVLVAVIAAMATSAIVGALNGTLVAALGIAPFIVTLGMIGVARGAANWIAGPSPLPLPDDLWIYDFVTPFPPLSWLWIAPGVWGVLLLTGAVALVLWGTVFGRHLHAVGSNETAAVLCGVRVRITKLLTYTLAGLFFGLAGVAQMAMTRQASAGASQGLELDLIAAAVIGGVRFGGGSGNLFGALLGALIMTVLRNGTQQAGWPVPLQQIVVGLAIIAVVGLDHWRRRGMESR